MTWPEMTIEQLLRIAPYLAHLCRLSEIRLHLNGRWYRIA